jgi:hypothetical protein
MPGGKEKPFAESLGLHSQWREHEPHVQMTDPSAVIVATFEVPDEPPLAT